MPTSFSIVATPANSNPKICRSWLSTCSPSAWYSRRLVMSWSAANNTGSSRPECGSYIREKLRSRAAICLRVPVSFTLEGVASRLLKKGGLCRTRRDLGGGDVEVKAIGGDRWRARSAGGQSHTGDGLSRRAILVRLYAAATQ